jgi:hypothetical protein
VPLKEHYKVSGGQEEGGTEEGEEGQEEGEVSREKEVGG